ncbi:MAG: hypothetical protein CSA32_00225 [Desulfobulbus propionicus]|nr:MAG: hypothetical protein CSA32_00225 [Desulfobulbus propionicus]
MSSIRALLPSFLIMAVIFFLSHQQAQAFPVQEIKHVDKAVHVLLYTILGLSYCHALKKRIHVAAQPVLLLTGIVFLCVVCGITDEFHQLYIPGRCFSWADIIADGAGGLCAVFLYRRPLVSQRLIE